MNAAPFLKWVGGKRQLIPQLAPLFPTYFDRYFEPFLGGGAMFFHFANAGAGRTSLLSDINSELITTYKIVRDNVDDLIRELQSYRYEVDFYYGIRATNPARASSLLVAARMIYLNRTCFNGVYRVNQSGKFNVPFGRYTNPTICDVENLYQCSRALQRTSLNAFSYDGWEPQAGDFVYFDPPYFPTSKTADFVSYTADRFGSNEQTRLRDYFNKLTDRGCYCMLSNSDVPEVHKLYEQHNITVVAAKRNINSNSSKRGAVGELVIRNYTR